METTTLCRMKAPSLGFGRSAQPSAKPCAIQIPVRTAHLVSSSSSKRALRLGLGKRANHGRCMAQGSGSVAGLERELEGELMEPEEMGRLGQKCKEKGEVVEVLESLEKEAIMGEDEGKDPTDYNRRAQIFDKSSKVFQALKENDNTAPADSEH